MRMTNQQKEELKKYYNPCKVVNDEDRYTEGIINLGSGNKKKSCPSMDEYDGNEKYGYDY